MFFLILTLLCNLAWVAGVLIIGANRDATVNIIFSTIFLSISFAIAIFYFIYSLLFLLGGNKTRYRIRWLSRRTDKRFLVFHQFVCYIFGFTAVTYMFWVLDGSLSREELWLGLNDTSVWAIWVHAYHATMLLYGTGGTTNYTPLSLLAEIYSGTLVISNGITIGIILATFFSSAYDTIKMERDQAKKARKRSQLNKASDPSKLNSRSYDSKSNIVRKRNDPRVVLSSNNVDWKQVYSSSS